jgi:hypothetical protein
MQIFSAGDIAFGGAAPLPANSASCVRVRLREMDRSAPCLWRVRPRRLTRWCRSSSRAATWLRAPDDGFGRLIGDSAREASAGVRPLAAASSSMLCSALNSNPGGAAPVRRAPPRKESRRDRPDGCRVRRFGMDDTSASAARRS